MAAMECKLMDKFPHQRGLSDTGAWLGAQTTDRTQAPSCTTAPVLLRSRLVSHIRFFMSHVPWCALLPRCNCLSGARAFLVSFALHGSTQASRGVLLISCGTVAHAGTSSSVLWLHCCVGQMDEGDRIEASFNRSSVSRPCTFGRPGATVLDLYIMRMRLRTVRDSQRGVASPAPSDRAFYVPEFKER